MWRWPHSSTCHKQTVQRWNTHTHPFTGPFSGSTRVSRYQKGKTNLDFTEARDSEWQWHQLGHMQVCTSLQIDNHASTPPLSFLQAECLSCCPTQQCQSTEGTMQCMRTGIYFFERGIIALHVGENYVSLLFLFSEEAWWTRTSFCSEHRYCFSIIRKMAFLLRRRPPLLWKITGYQPQPSSCPLLWHSQMGNRKGTWPVKPCSTKS